MQTVGRRMPAYRLFFKHERKFKIMSKYVRLIGDLNGTKVAIGLEHNGFSLVASESDDSLNPIPLAEINEDFYTGNDTAPLYNGFLQYRFLANDAKEITDYINTTTSFNIANVEVVDEYPNAPKTVRS